jgi:hypothetical protein
MPLWDTTEKDGMIYMKLLGTCVSKKLFPQVPEATDAAVEFAAGTLPPA